MKKMITPIITAIIAVVAYAMISASLIEQEPQAPEDEEEQSELLQKLYEHEQQFVIGRTFAEPREDIKGIIATYDATILCKHIRVGETVRVVNMSNGKSTTARINSIEKLDPTTGTGLLLSQEKYDEISDGKPQAPVRIEYMRPLPEALPYSTN